MKSPFLIPLEAISVASPCSADWNAMTGDERSRFCGVCAKNVYNLSALTRAQAETLIAEKEGDLCVRYFQRADGTMLTADCPIGLLRLQRNTPPRVLPWVQLSALSMLIGALIVGAVSPQILQAQPPEPLPSAPAPAPTLTPEPIATPEPTLPPQIIVPSAHQILPAATMGAPMMQPTATPAPEISVRIGDFAVAPTPVVTATPGLTATPAATATPVAKMGEVTAISAQPICEATPSNVTVRRMGRMAVVPVSTATPAANLDAK